MECQKILMDKKYERLWKENNIKIRYKKRVEINPKYRGNYNVGDHIKKTKIKLF